MKTWELIFAVGLLSIGSSAYAALIDYDESSDGDLPNFNETPASFMLDTAGVNVWRGSSATPTPAGTYELDYFNVDLGTGLQIVDYDLSITNIAELTGSSPGGADAIIRITSQDLSTNYATLRVGNVSPSTTNPVPLPWTDPLAVRTSYARGPDTYYSWDWEVRLTTANINGEIPEPTVLPLLGFGAAMMLLAGWSRRRAASSDRQGMLF